MKFRTLTDRIYLSPELAATFRSCHFQQLPARHLDRDQNSNRLPPRFPSVVANQKAPPTRQSRTPTAPHPQPLHAGADLHRLLQQLSFLRELEHSATSKMYSCESAAVPAPCLSLYPARFRRRHLKLPQLPPGTLMECRPLSSPTLVLSLRSTRTLSWSLGRRFNVNGTSRKKSNSIKNSIRSGRQGGTLSKKSPLKHGVASLPSFVPTSHLEPCGSLHCNSRIGRQPFIVSRTTPLAALAAWDMRIFALCRTTTRNPSSTSFRRLNMVTPGRNSLYWALQRVWPKPGRLQPLTTSAPLWS